MGRPKIAMEHMFWGLL